MEAERPRVADQHAQDSPPMRRVADLQLELGAHAVGDEALEARAGGIDDSECRVVRVGHSGGSFDNALEHSVERQLRADRDPVSTSVRRRSLSPLIGMGPMVSEDAVSSADFTPTAVSRDRRGIQVRGSPPMAGRDAWA